MHRLLALLALASLGLSHAWDQDGCTSIIASGGATVDGSALTSHANDCQDCDWRVSYVAAKDHAPGSMRKIYDAKWDQYPRLVDPSRSPSYTAAYGINSTNVLGEIPEVNHTFATWEASYGLINEKGLGMGESTCPAYIWGTGADAGGTALFTIGNLMAVALERCETARCAIKTMGELAETYGFYGEDPGIGGAGEAVTVVDRFGEAWVFHIMGCPQGDADSKYAEKRGAIWAAARVPDGHVSVIANTFMIRTIDSNDHDNFMYHEGLFDLAIEAKLWNGEGDFDFQKFMAPDLATFEYFPGLPPIPMYATLRVWSVLRHAAPSKNFKGTRFMGEYPFSVQVDKKIKQTDLMNWFRDHFEGTEFDMTLGAQAGPWQSPNRAEGGVGTKEIAGQFTRSSSIPRTSYTIVVQTGGTSEPAVWFAPDASASSVFVPFYAAALANDGGDGKFDIEAYGTGSMKSFSFGSTGGANGSPAPAWWAFDFVANWMELSYRNMSLHYVYPKVQSLQDEVADAYARHNEAARRLGSAVESSKYLADAQTNIQRDVVTTWWKFAEMLIVRYNDQFFNFGENSPTTVDTIGYPAFWLQMIGYDAGSYKPTWTTKTDAVPTMLPADQKACLARVDDSNLVADAPLQTEVEAANSHSQVLLLAVVFSFAGAIAGGGAVYKFGPRKAESREQYVRLLHA